MNALENYAAKQHLTARLAKVAGIPKGLLRAFEKMPESTAPWTKATFARETVFGKNHAKDYILNRARQWQAGQKSARAGGRSPVMGPAFRNRAEDHLFFGQNFSPTGKIP